MKSQTCCFSGHRKIPKAHYIALENALRNCIIDLINNGVLYFGSGGALGFDTLAAKTIISLRQQYPKIKLIMVYPCKSQTRFWCAEDINNYEKIKRLSDKVVYLSDEYTADCMFKRNRHLIDNSSYCICYLTKDDGGTAYTVNYARKSGLEIINLAEKL